MTEELIGNYRILEKIGAGGMAKVYLAVHKDVPNLRVILKILTDSRLVERFRQEADKLALLDGNPNICRIKHFFNHGENIVIAMEYIDGITVDEQIKKDGPIPVAESLRIITEVLKVLAFAHGKGVYHRDIKPSNIMIDSSGNVKVIDFGIAKAESDPSLTIAGTACGTPAYMAPEQFTPEETTNYALVDIYAVGTTLYHMLTGEVPFKGDNEFAIRDAKLFSDPPSPKSKAPAVSDQLDKLILRSLKKNPVERFATTAEMIEAVDCVRLKEEARQPTSVVPKVRAPRPKPPLKLIAGLAAIVVVVLIAIFGFGVLTDSLPSAPTAVSPSPGDVISMSKPTLSWHNTGADHYTLQYANNPDFLIPEVVRDLRDTFYTVTMQLENGPYYWRVKGTRGDVSGEFSGPYTFTVAAAGPPGRIEISVTPSGDIYVDDELLAQGSSSAAVDLNPGPHQLRVVNTKAVNKEFSETITVLSDSTIPLRYTFRMPSAGEPTPTQPPPATTGELRIGSRPTIGADIYIDGRLQDRKTPSAFRLNPGTYIVRAVLVVDGVRQERTDTIAVASGGSERIIFDFEK